MTEVELRIVPYLFMVLFGLILVNLVINVCIYSVSKIQQIKLLSWYWFSLLLTYLFQGQFQDGEMEILLSFSLNLIPCLLISKVMTDSLKKEFPFKKYVGLWSMGIVLTIIFKSLSLSFSASALPLCAALAVILMEPGFEALVTRRKTTSLAQKFTGLMYILGALHIINFALFRMQPGTQIWGWGAALGLYQVLSIALFAFAFEEYSREEKVRLQELVNERTEELSRSLRMKDTLFKMVLHDIANPIQGQLWIMKHLNQGMKVTPEIIAKLHRLTNLIRDVIHQVRLIEEFKSGVLSMELKPVSLQQCLNDLNLIFEGPLNQKGLKLIIHNELPPDTYFLADQNAFTTSVMCNLISNAIKFSDPDSELQIRAFMKDQKIVIEVEDEGIGMPKETVLGMFDANKKVSRPGTLGERGTGYGMPLVKSFVDYFGGNIVVESRPLESYPINHGTKITLTLNQILSH